MPVDFDRMLRGLDLSGAACADTPLAVASDLASQGWRVFPCGPNKRPLTARGFHDASTDETVLRDWFDGPFGTAMVGLVTESLVVLDLDDCGSTGSLEWWTAKAEAKGLNAGDSTIVRTPSGGLHLYFGQTGSTEIRCSAGKLAPGVDVRAAGGYVIAPGSQLPDGRKYFLVDGCQPKVPSVPGWLETMVEKPPPVCRSAPRRRPAAVTASDTTAYGAAGLVGEIERVLTAPIGCRNDSLNHAAFRCGQLVAGGELRREYAEEELVEAGILAGLPEKESIATVNSGLSSGEGFPRSAP